MKVCFLTNEYPPHIYGGAGVHVGYLSRELAKTIDVDVRCFGDQDSQKGRLKVKGYELDTGSFTCPEPLKSAFGAVRRCIDFNTTKMDADLVHCHTWYSHFGGILAKKNYGIPLVITTHSRDPVPGHGFSTRALRRRAGHDGDQGGNEAGCCGRAEDAQRNFLDRRDARSNGSGRTLLARSGVLLSVDLRTVWNHQPGGDGLR